MSLCLTTGGAQTSKYFYKNTNIYNFPMQIIFTIVDLILNQFAYLSKKVHTIFRSLTSRQIYVRTQNMQKNHLPE